MKNKARAILFAGCAILFAGCATQAPTSATARVKVADIGAVTSCTYLDTVFGSSGLYGVFAEQGMANARASALQQAETSGATHVVWLPVPQTYGSSQLAGKTYQCNP